MLTFLSAAALKQPRVLTHPHATIHTLFSDQPATPALGPRTHRVQAVVIANTPASPNDFSSPSDGALQWVQVQTPPCHSVAVEAQT